MMADDEITPGGKLATSVLQRIAKEKLEPYPSNYTLWYTYYSDSLPDLTRMIDKMVKEGRAFTQVRCDDLFQQFFSSDAEVRAVREAGERTQAALNKLLGVLAEAEVDSGRFVGTLGGFQAALQEPFGIDRLRTAIAAIAIETREIALEHERLQRRLTETGSELTQLRARLQTARRELMIDSLTSIANRKGFDDALLAASITALEEGKPLSLLMIDIDLFKNFNDRHGHLIGDLVLRLVAKILTDGVKGRDTVARFGGEEFTVILPRTSLADAVVLGDTLRVTVGRRQIINRSRNENFGTITLSLGATEYVPGESLNDMIARADAALYVAKGAGRNRVSFQAPPVLRNEID